METDLGTFLPKNFCIVCEHPSLLKCFGCDTTYCSQECQIQDWFNHKHQKSVNNQFTHAMEAKEKDSCCSMEIDDVTAKFQELTTHPTATDLIEIHDFLARPIACINKYRRSALIPKNIKDENGYFHVFVTSIDLKDTQNIIYSLTLSCLIKELTTFKIMLNVTYGNNEQVQLIQSASSFWKHSKTMIMALLEGQWTRCIHKETFDDGLVMLEDIDTGKRYKFSPSDPFKAPRRSELARYAFAFKVTLCNIYNPYAVDIGDHVKIRIAESNFRTISIAEIELATSSSLESITEDLVQEEKVESTVAANADLEWKFDAEEFVPKAKQKKESVPDEDRIFIKQLKVKNLPTGTQTLNYLDGSKLEHGKIHVCLATDEHQQFYDKLFRDIKAYIDENEDKNEYKPKLGELVLALFTADENVYRAIVIGVSPIDCKVSFIDFGSESNVAFDKIWKLPQQFLIPCVSRTVDVKLASGKELKEIDLLETVDKFAENDIFQANVEFLGGNKYAITVDDALIEFK